MLYWEHWLPRLFLKISPGENLAMALSANTIVVAKRYIKGKTLAHEADHTEDAKRKGWRYIPSRLNEYRRFGIENGPGEQAADAAADLNEAFYPAVVTPENAHMVGR